MATNHEIYAWLQLSRDWTTPQHHLEVVGIERARALLRGGADPHDAATALVPEAMTYQCLRDALIERGIPACAGRRSPGGWWVHSRRYFFVCALRKIAYLC